MVLVFLLQVALPIGLIAWLVLAPARNLIGYLAQVICTGLLLLALDVVALWTLLPWWLPRVYVLFLAATVVVTYRRNRFGGSGRIPATIAGWAGFLIMFVAGVAAAYLSWQGIAGRQLPDTGVVDIPLPLGPGRYLVANGGSSELVNAHMMTLNPDVERFRAYRGQSFGLDIIKIDRLGLRTSGGLLPTDPAAYAIYGEPVFAPCDGVVHASRNDRPDMQVPTMDLDVIEGNHVLLSCADFVVLLAHFQRGSVVVGPGDAVRAGDLLGTVGNSGKTGEPHLHISVQRPGPRSAPLAGDPLAVTIAGRFLVRNDIVHVDLD